MLLSSDGVGLLDHGEMSIGETLYMRYRVGKAILGLMGTQSGPARMVFSGLAE